MKTTIKNVLLQWIRSTQKYRRTGGEIQIFGRTKRKKRPSEKQRAIRDRFIQATNYAKKQMADEAMNALYTKGITKRNKSAYSVAVRDALTAPDVRHIDTANYHGAVGDIIAIRAFDDFKVVRVRVIIKTNEGLELERGEAVQSDYNPFLWTYTAKGVNRALTRTKLTVTAFDYPGNEGTLEEIL